MKPIGEKLAEIHCRNLGLDENTPEYEEEAKKYIFNFNDEAYGLSMTPSGLIGQNPQPHAIIGQNPATPKVEAHYFDFMTKMFGKDGYVGKHSKNGYEEIKFERQIRGSIASLVHFLLQTKYKVQIKRKGDDKSDFEYKKDGGAANDDTVLSQYLRLYYTVRLTKALEPLFLDEKIQIEKVITDMFGDLWKNEPYSALNPKGVREEFVKTLYSGKKKSEGKFKEVEPEETYEEKMEDYYHRQNPVKAVNDCYFSVDQELFFDKNKIDSFLSANKNECSQIKPKKEYLTHVTVSEKEIEKANMNEPILFGSYLKGGRLQHFLILGEAQILKAVNNGLPSIDSLILSPMDTLKMLKPTKKTMGKITNMKNELINSHGL
jgi:hypothetical protein